MWIRLRLDVGWRDLCYGFIKSLFPGNRQVAQTQLESFWSNGQDDALACLSVRSGFDLLLRSLEWPEKTEILFSAVTIADMPKIAKAHGLVPVPVDLCGSDYHIDIESLRQRITPRSRMLVVAHLFGARPDMQAVLDLAREHKLIVVEDCAQAWCELNWRGSALADVTLFSFGAIKTATAFGGALCRVKDPGLLGRMRKLESQQPSTAPRFPLKYLKFALLKMISTYLTFGGVVKIGKLVGKNVDDILGGLTRGFSGDDLFQELRKQPSAGTLKMLKHRLVTYDSQRIAQRIKNAQRIIANLGLAESQPELLDPQHTFWLIPFFSDRPDELIKHLRSQGFDSTSRGRMEVVASLSGHPGEGCPQAAGLLDRTVFLPAYPEMTLPAIDRMCRVIDEFRSNRLNR